MKKILALIMIVCFAPMVFAGDNDVAQNGESVKTFSLNHSVARVSSFATTTSTAQIDKVGSTKLGTMIIRNNTRDGFKITVDSEKLGVLEPAGTEDGEADIPYSISLAKTGDLGSGLDDDTAISSAELQSQHDFISMAGDAVTSETDCKYDVSVVISSDIESQLSLAGSYSDTLTFTYTDL